MKRLELTPYDVNLTLEALEHRASRLESMAKAHPSTAWLNRRKAEDMLALHKRFEHASRRTVPVMPVMLTEG